MSTEIVRVTRDNLAEAIKLACSVFQPYDYNAIRQELMASVGLEPETTDVLDAMEIHRAGYVMAYKDGKPAGISGYYSHVGHEADVWLGWTGVTSEFAGNGVGETVVRAAFDAAHFDGIKNLRIWTSNEDQYAAARRLYTRMGFKEEPYQANALPCMGASLARVFTKAANPDAGSDSWKRTGYRLPDLEIFDMPRLDRIAHSNFARQNLLEPAFAG